MLVAASGRNVVFEQVKKDVFKARLASVGLPDFFCVGLADLFEVLNEYGCKCCSTNKSNSVDQIVIRLRQQRADQDSGQTCDLEGIRCIH